MNKPKSAFLTQLPPDKVLNLGYSPQILLFGVSMCVTEGHGAIEMQVLGR